MLTSVCTRVETSFGRLLQSFPRTGHILCLWHATVAGPNIARPLEAIHSATNVSKCLKYLTVVIHLFRSLGPRVIVSLDEFRHIGL